MRLLPAALLLLVWSGCAGEQSQAAPVHRGPTPLVRGKAQQERLCSRGNRDVVTDIFCRDKPPEITGIEQLRKILGLGAEVDELDRGFVLSGHSTSLVHRSVSSINPRIIFVEHEAKAADFVALAFARGEQFSEIAVRNRGTGGLQFYLATFTLPCEQEPGGCLPGHLLTEETESGWTSFDIYGEEDLENTPKDCLTCHQPDGPDTPKILRMQELASPWNHWFYRLSAGGRALLDDYYAAKGDETFAGVPADDIYYSQPGLLAFTLFNISPPQTNLFVSERIQAEVIASASAKGGDQPADNSVPGDSPTWRAIYDRAKRGEAISVPYHDVKVTDASKLAAMTEAYAAYRAGELSLDELPDIRDVFVEDPQLQAHMGLVTEPGLSGQEVLLQACSQCHNGRLDQTLTRARFDVDLSKVSRETKDRAIERIMLDEGDPAVMPPPLSRRLSDEGRKRLIELLQK